MTKRRVCLSCLFGLGAVLSQSACTSSSDATLTVVNHSDFTIVDIRVAPVQTVDFGPNLLGTDVLLPGEQLTLGVTCGTYDAEVVDEQGVTCDVNDIDLCLNDARWVLTNSTCTVF